MIGHIALNLSFREFQALCCLFENSNFSQLDFPNACGLNELENIRFKTFMLYQDLYSSWFSINPDVLIAERQRFFGDLKTIYNPFLLSMRNEQPNPV